MAFNFKRKIAEIERKKRTLPRQVGNIAKNHFLKSFKDGGFTDESFSPWKARKTRDKSDRRNPNKRRALLVKTGQLKRSIRVGRATWNRIEVGSYQIKYAARHNQGLAGMPKRQFIGESGQMNRKIKEKIRSEIKQAFRK